MTNTVSLTMTEAQRELLAQHLFPSDGNEAVAIALCGRARWGERQRLIMRKIEPVPYASCSDRRPDCVTWSTALLPALLEEAAKRGLGVLKIHGHLGLDAFSEVDDESDKALFPSVHAWVEPGGPHGSAILMPDGRLFGRTVSESGVFKAFSHVSVVGDSIEWQRSGVPVVATVPAFGRRVAQTFGSGTFARLRELRIGVVGASGTGSVVIEQLARNGVGSLVIVDPDQVEEKNLNRILNATMADAQDATLKVELARRSIAAMGLGTEVETFARDIFHPDVVRALSTCDALFGCVDTVDGRHMLNRLATFYCVPFFDLGVKIEADGKGGVEQVCGTVHYLKPGGSSLLSRGTFSTEQVRAAGLRRTDPTGYAELVKEGYLRGVAEDRPAVIQLNSLIASLAVNELLARVHPYRDEPNAEFAVTRVSLTHGFLVREGDGDPCALLARHVGRGDAAPLLDWPELSERAAP